jgi:transposase
MASPYDLEARSRSQRETHGVGYKVHRTETCDADHPARITQVMPTPATTPDRVMGPALHQDLADRDLLPGTHVLDSGDVDADLLVTAQTPHQIDVVGPPFGSYRRQRREGKGDDLQAFAIDWEAQQARCPQGHSRVHWRLEYHVAGDPVVRIRVDTATCRVCPARSACTWAKDAPRQRTVSPQAHPAVLQAARQRQETPQFNAPDALRAGVESRVSPGVRCVELRRSRYLGLARTHLQQLLTATAMHVVRVIAWLWGEPVGERRRPPGHLAQLSPHPLSRQTVLC